MSFTKEDIYEMVSKSDVPVSFEWKYLKHAFGEYKRVSGIDYTLAKLIHSGVTEERLSYLPDYDIKIKINEFCIEKGFMFFDSDNYPNNFTDRTIIFEKKSLYHG